jgi:anti-sigma regulatory factor (Ser/Thr protein kinase)
MQECDHFEGPARMSSLPAFIAGIDRFCMRESLPHALALRLQLLCEELFTNTVTHGHGGDCDVPVRMSLQRLGDAVEMRYEDGAPPFDPLAAGRKALLERDQRLRGLAVGGVGLSLLVELCSAASHVRRGDRNCTLLRLDAGLPPDTAAARDPA